MEWLCTPPDLRVPGTQREWATANIVSPTTLTEWKKDTEFRRAWDMRLTELQIDPEKIDQVMSALFAKAVAGSEKAIQMYLQVVREFRPPPELEQADEGPGLGELSDDDLKAMIAEAASAELDARRTAEGLE